MKTVIKGTNATATLDLINWCKDYQFFGIHPLTTRDRFACGVYQIHQGMAWVDGVPPEFKQYESYAAAALHFMMTAESLKECVAESAFWNSPDVRGFSFRYAGPDYRAMLYKISEAQQQVFYGSFVSNKPGYDRVKRFSPKRLRDVLASLAIEMFAVIPPTQRSAAIEQATELMTKKL